MSKRSQLNCKCVLVYETKTEILDRLKPVFRVWEFSQLKLVTFRDFKLIGKKKSLTIQQFKSGKYITPYENFKINLKALPFKIAKIEIDNEVLDLKKLKINGDNSFVIGKEFNRLYITGK